MRSMAAHCKRSRQPGEVYSMDPELPAEVIDAVFKASAGGTPPSCQAIADHVISG